ncbi:MAG: GDP-mannose 4,6-dehydratase [Minisyncoccia bacterium]|jgi:dTDP-glucose 4,6-dehydratase
MIKKKSKKRPQKRKTVLITGGAGFIGSAVVRYLHNKYPKYHFIILDALTYAGDIRNIPESIRQSKNFEFHYGDIRNQKLVEHLVSRSDVVLHFAAETHVARSIFDDINFFETDVIGTQRLASAVLRNKKTIDRFIHISTSEVYGTALSRKMSEKHPLNPQSPYAAAKAGADRLVYSYMATYKLPAVIVRPFNMFGPNQHLEKLIPRFITSCILNEPLTIHGSGTSRRDFTYVDDLARAIDMILHAPAKKVVGQVFNVGSGRDVSVGEIANLIIKMMNRRDKKDSSVRYGSSPLNIGDRPGQVFRHTADTTKILKALSWKPRMAFKEGLALTIDWYIKNEGWWRDKLWMRHVPVETEKGKTEMH